MSITTYTASGIKQIERTFRVERETPVNGSYRIRIHRELISYDTDDTELGRVPLLFAFDEPASKVATMAATAAYIAAVSTAVTVSDIIHAESTWYDSLITERREEIAAGG